MIRIRRRRCFPPCAGQLLPVLILLAGPLAHCQESPQAAPALPTVADIQARLEAARTSTDMSEDLKARYVEILEYTLSSLARVEEWRAKIAEYDAGIADAPNAIEQLQSQIEGPVDTPAFTIDETAQVETLETELVQRQAELEAARAELLTLQGEPARRTERRRAIPELLTRAQTSLQEVQAQLDTATTDNPDMAEARRTNLLVRRTARELEIEAYQKELQFYDARAQLVTLRIAAAARRVTQLEGAIAAISAAVSELRSRRARDAAASLLSTVGEISGFSEELRVFAEEMARDIARLAEQRVGETGAAAEIERANADLKRISDRIQSLDQDFTGIQQRVSAAGSSEVVGRLLRQQAGQMPDIREHQKNIRARDRRLSEIQIAQIERQEESLSLSDPEPHVRRVLAAYGAGIPESEIESAEATLRQLFRAKQQVIDSLYAEYERLIGILVSLDRAERDLVARTAQFQAYISERVLFIRSGTIPNRATLDAAVTAFRWAIEAARWTGLSRAFTYEARRQLTATVLTGLLLLAGVLFRRRLLGLLESSGAAAEKRTSIEFRHTAEALLCTVALAFPLPLLLGGVGFALTNSIISDRFAGMLGTALLAAACILFISGLINFTFHRNGLAVRHFEWPQESTERLRRRIRSYLAAAAVLTFGIVFFHASGEEASRESAARGLYVLLMALTAGIAFRMFRPNRGPFQALIGARRGDLAGRAATAFWLAASITPAALAIAAVAGYYYTAWQISTRIFFSITFALALLLAYRLIYRWIQLAQRRLAREQARKRREALKASQPEEELLEAVAAPKDEALDLAQIDVQSQRLLRSACWIAAALALWLIWIDIVPALNKLNEIKIASTTQTVTRQIIDPDTDKVSVETHDEIRAITLVHVILAAFIGFITLILARNVPGLLEITLLQRLRLGAGERYAITTVVRYVITAIGIVVAFQSIGIGWGKVQSLVAALGLGLGFGLQEIFANFVSGIILLFERPIRLGDVVTIGGVNGRVTRIRIRATTITDFDRKDLVVPNKEFITGQLINWSLTDNVLRIVIPVGVAYDSDVELVEKTLYDVAESDPGVLDDPAPVVVFTRFGESTLDFELRVFCANIEAYLPLLHRMHKAITLKFRERGIEIAYPQMDLHVRGIAETAPFAEPYKLSGRANPG